MRVIGQSIALDRDHAEMLTRRHANERIALFLHGLGERPGHIGQSPLQFRLAMSREDIASYLGLAFRSEEHTSALQSLMRTSNAVFRLTQQTCAINVNSHTSY